MESDKKQELIKQYRSEWIRHYDDSHSLWSSFSFDLSNLDSSNTPSFNLNNKSLQQFPIPDGRLFIHQFMSHSICSFMREQNDRIKLLEIKLALAEKKLNETGSGKKQSENETTVTISPSTLLQHHQYQHQTLVNVDCSTSKPEPGKSTCNNMDVDSETFSPIMFFTPTSTPTVVSSMSPPLPKIPGYSQRLVSMTTPEKCTKKSKLESVFLNNDSDDDSGNSTQTSPSLMTSNSFRRLRYPHPAKENIPVRVKEGKISSSGSGAGTDVVPTVVAVAVVKSPKKLLLPGLDDNPIENPKPKIVSKSLASSSGSTEQWISVDKSAVQRNNQKKSTQSKLTSSFPRSISANSSNVIANANSSIKSNLIKDRNNKVTSSSSVSDSFSTVNLDDDLDDFSNRKLRVTKNTPSFGKRLIQTKIDINKLFDRNGTRGKHEDLTNTEEYLGGARSPFIAEALAVDTTLKPKIGAHSDSPGGIKRKIETHSNLEELGGENNVIVEDDGGVNLSSELALSQREKIWRKEVEEIQMVFGDKDFEQTYFDETSQLLIHNLERNPGLVQLPPPQPQLQNNVTPLTSRPRSNSNIVRNQNQKQLINPEMNKHQQKQEKDFVFRKKSSSDFADIPTVGNDTLEVIDGFDRLPGADSPSPKFMYKPDKAVRKKAERDKLPGVVCDMCRDYYNEISSQLNPGDITRIINKCSKHREKYVARAACTPPDYWRTDFPSTAECIEKGYLHIETPDPFMDPKMKNKISRY